MKFRVRRTLKLIDIRGRHFEDKIRKDLLVRRMKQDLENRAIEQLERKVVELAEGRERLQLKVAELRVRLYERRAFNACLRMRIAQVNQKTETLSRRMARKRRRALRLWQPRRIH